MSDLRTTVIDHGFCIGCGACAVVAPDAFDVRMDSVGRLQAVALTVEGASTEAASRVCPFSDHSINESVLAESLFSDLPVHPEVGRHRRAYAGHVGDNGFRAAGSSGGMGTWILSELLRTGEVDAVLHVTPTDPAETDGLLFKFAISTSNQQILARSKSRYYPITMQEVLRHVALVPGRYAVVGVPCFIKAIRLLQREQPVFRERVLFTVGLVCGHLKSAGFAELLAWQLGVQPSDLDAFDFRHKLEDQPANRYGVKAWHSAESDGLVGRSWELLGGNWGHGMMKYKACEACDDVVAELADVSVGDAWLPEYSNDSKGTNVVVTRHPLIERLIEQARTDGRLALDQITADRVAKSQESGLRHRREGLAVRLWLWDRAREWRPRKRIEPNPRAADARRRKLYALRLRISERSHSAFAQAKAAGDLALFRTTMNQLLAEYRSLYVPPIWKRALSKVRRMLRLNPRPSQRTGI